MYGKQFNQKKGSGDATSRTVDGLDEASFRLITDPPRHHAPGMPEWNESAIIGQQSISQSQVSQSHATHIRQQQQSSSSSQMRPRGYQSSSIEQPVASSSSSRHLATHSRSSGRDRAKHQNSFVSTAYSVHDAFEANPAALSSDGSKLSIVSITPAINTLALSDLAETHVHATKNKNDHKHLKSRIPLQVSLELL